MLPHSVTDMYSKEAGSKDQYHLKITVFQCLYLNKPASSWSSKYHGYAMKGNHQVAKYIFYLFVTFSFSMMCVVQRQSDLDEKV